MAAKKKSATTIKRFTETTRGRRRPWYSEEFKRDTVQRIRGGESPMVLAETLGVSRATLHNWVSKGIGDEKASRRKRDIPALVPDTADDSIVTFDGGGYYGQYVDLGGGSSTTENDLIKRYRSAALYPEVDIAISDIVDQAIASSETSAPVAIRMDDLDLNEKVKGEIVEGFNDVIRLLRFNNLATDIFRDWYIDGRLYYHLMIDPKRLKDGIQEVRRVDPIKIKKVKEVSTKRDRTSNRTTQEVTAEYFAYSDTDGPGGSGSGELIRVDKNAIVYVPSGLTDETGKRTISYLHKSLKLINQLRMLEDSLVIYRVSRAPERRIFYIDVGNLQKGKAEQYIQSYINRYRNKLVYDAETGQIRDDRKNMAMLEDFWLPRKEGGRGTEITTLPGGSALGEVDDILFFQKKLYKSLNVPAGRLEQDAAYAFGRATEINREEVKFQRFIDKLRKKFSNLFLDMLRVQLVLKQVITIDEWEKIREDLVIDFLEDNYFAELKELEILRERLEMLSQVNEYVGRFFSNSWIKRNVLRFDEETLQRMQEEIDEEKDSGEMPETDEFGAEVA